jgi:SecD/SecF fusion protein
MRRLALATCLLLCASPAAARGVHMVLKVDVPAEEAGRRDEIMSGCRDVVRQRLEKLGVESVKVAVDGPDRIVADIADYSDLAKLRQTFDPARHSLSLRLVDEAILDEDLRAGRAPKGVDIVEQRAGDRNHPPFALYRDGGLSSARIEQASMEFDPRTGEPRVAFKFDSLGRSQFAKITTDKTGSRFAIVLDGKIVAAPVIREPILGGSGVIEGNFTVQEASDLAASLTGGAAPAPWTIVDLKPTR